MHYSGLSQKVSNKLPLYLEGAFHAHKGHDLITLKTFQALLEKYIEKDFNHVEEQDWHSYFHSSLTPLPFTCQLTSVVYWA